MMGTPAAASRACSARTSRTWIQIITRAPGRGGSVPGHLEQARAKEEHHPGIIQRAELPADSQAQDVTVERRLRSKPLGRSRIRLLRTSTRLFQQHVQWHGRSTRTHAEPPETPSSIWLVGGAPNRIFCCSLFLGEFAAKLGGLELYRLVTSIVRLTCGIPRPPETPGRFRVTERSSCVTWVAVGGVSALRGLWAACDRSAVPGARCGGRGHCGRAERRLLRGRPRLSLDELLAAVDVEGRAGDRGVGHEVDGQCGDVGWADEAADRQRGAELLAALVDLIAEQ